MPATHGNHQLLFKCVRQSAGCWLNAVGKTVVSLWVICGLMVCTETLPDVIGHAHEYSEGHPFEPWNGETDDQTKPPPNAPGQFHYHVVHDFSSVEADFLGALAPSLDAQDRLARRPCEHQPAPDGPFYEMLEPPLI